MPIQPFSLLGEGGERVVALTAADFEAVEETLEGLQALAARLSRALLAGRRTELIDDWVTYLPENEAAALNGVLGQNYGDAPSWDSDHPISVVLRDEL